MADELLQMHPIANGAIDQTTNLYPLVKEECIIKTENNVTKQINLQHKLTTDAYLSINNTNNKIGVVTSKFIDLIYPVGSIYISVSSTNPGTLFGGTWEQIKGRFLVAAGNNESTGTDALNLENEATGGYTNSSIPTHTHSASGTFTGTAVTTSESGSHTHTASVYRDNGGNSVFRSGSTGASHSYNAETNTNGAHTHTVTAAGTVSVTVNSAGESSSYKNLPPYLTVCVWKRTN